MRLILIKLQQLILSFEGDCLLLPKFEFLGTLRCDCLVFMLLLVLPLF